MSACDWPPSIPVVARPERPLLEGRAEAVLVEPHDPQVAVVERDRVAVPDLDSHHARVALRGDDLGLHPEHLGRALALTLPQLRDRLEAVLCLLERAHAVGRVGGEQVREPVGPRRAPSALVGVDPGAEASAFHGWAGYSPGPAIGAGPGLGRLPGGGRSETAIGRRRRTGEVGGSPATAVLPAVLGCLETPYNRCNISAAPMPAAAGIVTRPVSRSRRSSSSSSVAASIPPAAPQRMTHRDRAAVHVHAVGIEVEIAHVMERDPQRPRSPRTDQRPRSSCRRARGRGGWRERSRSGAGA